MTAATTVATLNPKPRSLWSDALRRMFTDRLTIVGLVIVGLALLCAILAPVIAPYDPIKGDIANQYVQPPSSEHLFGTDDVGRDVMSRVIYGAQISLKIAIFAEALGVALGTVIGLFTGYYGGWLDTLIMRFVDIFMAFPLLIIAIALVAALGPSETNILIALALVIWPFVTRLVRSQVLASRESEYVAAARLVGVSDVGIMFRHILPNILTPLVVYATLGTANIILQEAALSFLGLGSAEQSTPSWGKMLNESRAFIRSAWWMPFYPGLAILLTVLGFNLLGDGLRDALDVRTRE
ncbi:MAG: ABC transporter permease [Anaerolineae bacterium]|nr:ABC transporter permease [Anaerolineae bacterium]